MPRVEQIVINIELPLAELIRLVVAIGGAK